MLLAGLALAGAFIALRLFALGGAITEVPDVQQPSLLAAAGAFYAAALMAYALLWRTLVCRLDRFYPRRIDSLAVFFASWLGRYVPTSLPYLAGKVVMGMRLGHSKSALAASVLYENLLMIAVSALWSCVALPLALSDSQRPATLIAIGLGGAATLALLSPPVLGRLIALGALVARRPAPDGLVLPPGGLATAVTFAALAVLGSGMSFALVLGSFVSLGGREVIASAAVYSLAGVAGTLALPVPSGLGVREAVIVGLVQLYAPLEVAAAAAVLSRLISLGVDVLSGVAGAAWYTYRHSTRAAGLPHERARAA
ncbi:MAG: lysylphosphatidylglycerol synthase domain-containing protein [Dehalococcoidia bacterium]